MHESARISIAPGSVVIVRDEEWLVTGVEHTADGRLLSCQGLSELVKDTTASFYEGLDADLRVLDPAQATVVADDSPHYRRSRLWLEATLRKTAVPLDGTALTVTADMLADPLGYQQAAVRKALDQANLRTRILLADAVGLGKTLEIGMILSELIRRGRGERILIVTPRHVLEQMQNEMWSRFAIPFVRLDSLGIQRVRQKLPATRNPFSYFKRVIISIDTLKSRQYLDHLRRQSWDAIVIDESHNITNSGTLNNSLAKVLAPSTDALILASATPHNGKPESFAELIRLLEPTAVRPDGTVIEDEVSRLVIRRHRHSPEVASEVGADWAERKEPQNWLVPASAAENAVARELDTVWLHPVGGASPYSGSTALFPWTLAKAFLSSPAALSESIKERIGRIGRVPTAAQQREIDALTRLAALAADADDSDSGKYTQLLAYLRKLGVGPNSDTRVVIFAERVRTLKWLRGHLQSDLKLNDKQVVILHGGLTDTEQQTVVDDFKQTSSPVRVLITGDLASEGVNLHAQCHELIHFDIPWSLIRIEQRNGRIDRYGQRHAPQITTLLLNPVTETFSGDLRVLSRLIEKEHEAHTALGDAASLMGKYDVDAEEDEIRKVLAGKATLDDVVKDTRQVKDEDSLTGMLARISAGQGAGGTPLPTATGSADTAQSSSLYPSQVAFLEDALREAYPSPAEPDPAGVDWRVYAPQQIVELTPPADLRQRLEVLPQSYLAERKVAKQFKLVTSKARGKALLADALTDDSDSSWPEAHFLGPLHPVIDWAADRAMASLGRNQVFAARGDVDHPTVLLLGTLTNRRGQVVASSYLTAEFPNPANLRFCIVTPHESATAMTDSVGYAGQASNPGAVADVRALQPLVTQAAQSAAAEMAATFAAAQDNITNQVAEWSQRVTDWTVEADALVQRSELRQRRVSVEVEQSIAARMVPERQLIRPVLIVVPRDHPVDGTANGSDESHRRGGN